MKLATGKGWKGWKIQNVTDQTESNTSLSIFLLSISILFFLSHTIKVMRVIKVMMMNNSHHRGEERRRDEVGLSTHLFS